MVINKTHEFRQINNILYIMTSELDEDSGYELVKRNGKVIANYPIDKLKELINIFKDKDMCSTSEFIDYASLNDFVNSIYFLEFLEYFLNDFSRFRPDLISYIKKKKNATNIELKVYHTPLFRDLIANCNKFLKMKKFENNQLEDLYDNVRNDYDRLKKIPMFSDENKKLKKILIRLYDGFLHFLYLLINRPSDIDITMNLFMILNNKLAEGKLNKKNERFNQSSLSMIYNLFTYDKMLEYKKQLLSQFRLFQRKYLSAIAKLKKIGPPSASPEESKKIKKELNKNKNVDYKAYEIFCKYVLSKEENEAIYDYLAGIHKNSNESVIHKNINNKTVSNIKVNTKKTHHKEYLEKSEAILQIVESKIKERGDIIDIKTKSQVKAIRELFDSKQYKNETFLFGNNLFEQKIIRYCKTIRVINKQIDKMIKDHIKKEQKRRKEEQKLRKEEQKRRKEEEQEQRKEENKKNTKTSNFLSDLLEKHPEIKSEQNPKKRIHKLLLKYHPNKRQGLTNNEIKKTSEITDKLTNLMKSL
jgi:hypothetical protein